MKPVDRIAGTGGLDYEGGPLVFAAGQDDEAFRCLRESVETGTVGGAAG